MGNTRLSGRRFTLAGGDRRHDYLGETLVGLGAEVRFARRRRPRLAEACHTSDLGEAMAGADVLVCPLAPFGPGGRIWSEDPEDRLFLTARELGRLAKPSLAFAGEFPPSLAGEAGRAGCETIALGELDELAVLNSIPTAEGAVLMALERSTVTIRGSKAVVLGYGRTGQTLAATLVALGAEVWVAARRPAARARAVAAGCSAVDFAGLGAVVPGARFIFNTVPALVLVGDVLSRAHPKVVIVDLASAPGGTDFEAAAILGLCAVLAPSLPGRVAPETSAANLADVVVQAALERFGLVEV